MKKIMHILKFTVPLLFVLIFSDCSSKKEEPAEESTSLKEEFALTFRIRNDNQVKEEIKNINPENMGIVIIDMWNHHWCKTATNRVSTMVPGFNKSFETARKLGMKIFWAPTDGIARHMGTIPRERAAAVPYHEINETRDLQVNFTHGRKDCLCGPGIQCMGDNGPFMQYASSSGQSDRIYRGGKAEHLEGGVRVNAFVKWEGVIEAGSTAKDIIHVSDLFTTFARLAQATDEMPRDRIIDGVDQSGVLLLGETNGRRDYVFIYEEHRLQSVVKNKYKMHLPPPGSNPIVTAGFYDLYRDSREERPQNSILMGPWAGGQFGAMINRHLTNKKKYPDTPETHAKPYEGIENVRPESKKLVDAFYSEGH